MTEIIDPITYAWKQIHGGELPKELSLNYGKDVTKGAGMRGRARKPKGSTFVANPEKGIRA